MIESKPVEHKGVTLPSVPYIVWTGTTDKSSAQALDQMDNGGERKEKVTLAQAAQTFLDDELSAGPLDLDALKERAESTGHAWRNVRRAATLLRVISESEGFGPGAENDVGVPPNRTISDPAPISYRGLVTMDQPLYL